MTIKYFSEFLRKFRKLTKNNLSLRLREKVAEKIEIFRLNHEYPSLRLHKVSVAVGDAWSISVDRKIRVLFVYREYGVLLVDIGGHDEVY